MKLRSSLPLVAAVLFLPALRAQDDNVRIYGQARDYATDRLLYDYVVIATDTADTTERWSATVDLKGKYELKLPYDRVYRVEMSASEHWSKHVLVDVHDVDPGMRRTGFSLFIELSLIEPYDIGDPALLHKPMGIARYSPRKKNMVWDEAYTKRIKEQWDAETRRKGAQRRSSDKDKKK